MGKVSRLTHRTEGQFGKLLRSLEDRGYASLGIGVASMLLFLAFCASVVAVACPYWRQPSTQTDGLAMTSSASLWRVSVTLEGRNDSSEVEMAMCSDQMQGFEDCGKINLLRFFVVGSSVLSGSCAVLLLVAFLPLLKYSPDSRSSLTFYAITTSCVIPSLTFLGICIAASVDMTDGYSLTGEGFCFLVVEILLQILALVALRPFHHLFPRNMEDEIAVEQHLRRKSGEAADLQVDIPTLLRIMSKHNNSSSSLDKDVTPRAKNVLDPADLEAQREVALPSAVVLSHSFNALGSGRVHKGEVRPAEPAAFDTVVPTGRVVFSPRVEVLDLSSDS